MSRDIKFRFWDGTSGNMAMCYQDERGYFKYPSSGFLLEFHQAWAEARATEGYDKPKSLMQYTGFRDKNGVDIYEGDILLLRNSRGQISNYQEVYWDSDVAAFNWRTANDDSWPDGFTGFHDDYEVIGNIYKHPELLAE